jgi:hypothetical protein
MNRTLLNGGIGKKGILIIILSITLVNTGCVSSENMRIIDRNIPESVLRAYFIAWERGEWDVQLSMMDGKYQGMAPEPANTIKIVSIDPIASYTKDDCNYRVIFDIEVAGQGVSMHTGRYDWNYYLRWNENRKSWLIINYGVG